MHLTFLNGVCTKAHGKREIKTRKRMCCQGAAEGGSNEQFRAEKAC